MSESYIEVELNHQPVELCKLLKIANLVAGGGEAKVVISEGYVLLNGEVEYQKRKKIYHNDVVEFNGEVIQLVINEELSEAPESPSTPMMAEAKQKESKNENKKKPKADSIAATVEVAVPKKRRPISF